MKNISKATHTPGPWKKLGRDIVSTKAIGSQAGDFFLVCNVGINTDCQTVEKCDANATLIAAAPELLAICKVMIAFLQTPIDLRAKDDLKVIILEMNQAIAKAEGRINKELR